MSPAVAPDFCLETLSEIGREGEPKPSGSYRLAGETQTEVQLCEAAENLWSRKLVGGEGERA